MVTHKIVRLGKENERVTKFLPKFLPDEVKTDFSVAA